MRSLQLVLGFSSVALLGCSGDDSSNASDSNTDSTTAATDSGTDSTTASTDSVSASATDTSATSAGTDSASGGTDSATDSAGTDSATSGSASATDSATGGTSSGTAGTSGTGGSSGTAGTSSGTAGTGSGTAGTGSTGGISGTSGGTGDPCAGMMPPNMFDFSYIWISNSPAGTVSKIDTATGIEEGRYVSGPIGMQDPSRTSVSQDGRHAVAVNRNGSITMYAAEGKDCVDKNNDTIIQTSTGPGDVLPWGSDECQIWNVPLPANGSSGPRPVSWNIGEQNPQTCEYAMGDVWVGWYDAGNVGHFRLLNGEDGQTITDVLVNNWSGENWGPYGGAVDGDNNFWVTGWGTNGPVVKIDGANYQPTHYGSAGGWIYGMGLDLSGNTWAAGCGNGNIYKFDKGLEQWSLAATVNAGCLRGLQVDSKDRAFIAKNSPCGVAVIDTTNNQVINGDVPIPGCGTPVGISIDAEGYVWIVDQSTSSAYKMDPDTYQIVDTVTGLVSPYTYSDMTGAGLNNQIMPQ